MCGLRCRRSMRPSLRHHGAKFYFHDVSSRVFLPVEGAARRESAAGFSETSGDELGGQNCPSAEEDCLDWRLLERGCLSGRYGKSSASTARRGIGGKTQKYRLR